MLHPDKQSKSIALGLLIALTGISGTRTARATEPFELQVVSSAPDWVSGGDSLVRLGSPDHPGWVVELDGQDVTSSFRPATGSPDRLALIGGLNPGKNRLQVFVEGSLVSTLDVLDHPLAGPIFSGPHQKPFLCQTVDNGLGPPVDPDCDATTVVQYYYKSTNPAQASLVSLIDNKPGSLSAGFKPYPLSEPPPTDVAEVRTADGSTLKYIVRREVGTINRAVYDIQFLHQPGEALPTPWTRVARGWNGRLVYLFVGGCGSGHHQGTLGAIGRDQEPLLTQGYAVATSTLNVFLNQCDTRVSAETLSMVKEHFTKEYGAPVHTIGWGGSGGAIQQNLIAQQYPGLLDGLVTTFSFPDIVNAVQSSTDCSLLEHAFTTSNQQWSDEQKAAVSGFATWRTCTKGWQQKFVDPENCDPVIPRESIYNRKTNSKGLRCDFFDNEADVLGRDPQTGLARRPLDNVGVQYGLLAFQQRVISAEQFVDLNERIGGYDRDGTIVAARSAADPQALRSAYAQGIVLTGGGGLGRVPTIDWRPYLDDLADAHDILRTFVTRARLIAANGSADNQVILIDPMLDALNEFVSPDPATSVFAKRQRDLVRQMDLWLDRIAADDSPVSAPGKIARNRPPGLEEGCWQVNGKRIAEAARYGTGRCEQLYPSHGDPRLAAGAPLTDDVLKCTLRPVNPADYPQTLTSDQMRRLRAIFPQGVCDYDRPGAGQQMITLTFQQHGQARGQ